MRLETIQIPNDVTPLAGLRYVPSKTRKATALLYAHGFTSSKHSFDGLASYLAGRGYEGVSFDFPGHKMGATGGELQSMGEAVSSVHSALLWLVENTEAERVVLVGHSLGAAASLAVAANARHSVLNLAGVVSLCMGAEPARGFSSVVGRAMLAQRADYVVGKPALELLLELEGVLPTAGALDGFPSLFLAAKQDVLVSPERVEALARVLGGEEISTLDASHVDAPDKAKSAIIGWLEAQGW